MTLLLLHFSGFVTDEEVERQESRLRQLLKNDGQFRVKEGTSVEVAQVIQLYQIILYWNTL